MPLLDHFRPPLNLRRGWRGFHSHWAANIATSLNRVLLDGWFAEESTETEGEIDVGIADERDAVRAGGGPATLPLTNVYRPPAPLTVADFQTAGNSTEVRIYNATAGPVLAGSIELVSPAKKDRPATRAVFLAK